MKHSFRITLLLIGIFVLAQLAGLAVIAKYLDAAALQQGEIAWSALPFGFERPPVDESVSYWYILGAVLIGTVLALILIRLRAVRSWKLWFLLAVTLCLAIVLSTILTQWLALLLAFVLAFWKIYRPNVIIHNLTEILLYGGLAAIFVPILNIFSASVLLILIAVYDAIAVWHSKHMVHIAKFQSKSRVFAGVFLPYHGKMGTPKRGSGATTQIAVLGGGDIAFPLLFTGAVLKWLLSSHPLGEALFISLVITLCVTGSLAALLLLAKPKRFYPAMPFLAAGCFVGYGVLKLII
ncbi:MAG TPA: presenilin family intramembrane aspartyl protease [Candidatus Nanoarchaeia archaeon]|nr:presenilin family intramembrane aspartyl protease [Candidatus Nanoarchaeia archaeon]